MTQQPTAADGAGMRQTLFLIFAVSGFSGLIYESIWSHYLKLFLGHAAYAQTIVLAIFMGGMAIGAAIAARFTSRWRGLLMGYALVEGLVGVAAIVFHGVFVALMDVSHASILPALGSPGLAQAYKWTLSGLLILPQSILLGMTFPLMSVGIIRRFPQAPGSVLAMLYFSNSIGAAIGVMAGGFFLIGRLGLPGSILTAGRINIALALTVWALLKREGGEPLPTPAAAGGDASAGDRRWYRFL
ncbi:MAG TPA: spermidine synthase, partial [Pelomicrobium sp.]|nr:spermidine synthase [Pelomicrobium sp.]